jgi:beta-lactamase regulating signal transducer with metallopeptidase domain
MNTLYEAFAAALFHFLWQGAAIAALLSVVLIGLRRSSANSRYVAACVALGLMVILPAVTTMVLYEPQGGTVTSAVPALPDEPGAEVVGGDVAGSESMAGAGQPREFAGAFDMLPLSWAELRAWAVPVWLLGILLFSLRLLWAYGYVVGLRQHATVSDAKTCTAAQQLAERMGVARPIRVMISAIADGPSVVGWWRPVILLPSATLIGLTPWQLEAVLAHELAHVRRHDYLVNMLQSVVEILLFYHPAVWWVSNCVRRERELCCDDLAVALSGDAVGYARALTILERQRLRLPRAQAAMAAADGWLGLRVRRLVGMVQDPNRPTLVSGLLALGLALGVLAVGVNTTDSVAQEGAGAAGAGAEPSELSAERVYRSQLAQPGRVLPAPEGLENLPALGAMFRSLTGATLSSVWSDVDRVIRAAQASELPEAQLAWVQSTAESNRGQVTSAASRVTADERDLESLLGAESVNRGAVSTRIESLIASRGELERTTANMALTVRERLTQDEWARLNNSLGQGVSLSFIRNGAGVTTEFGTRGGGARGGGAGAGAPGAAAPGAAGGGRGGRRGGPPPTDPPAITLPTPQ